MKRCGALLTLLFFALVVGGTSHAARTYVTSEKGVDRPGLDYRSFWLPKDNPELCREACADDEKCKAYTYVKPGVQGSQARCLLKGRVPSAKRNDCCVSGVKTTKRATATTSSPVSGPVAKMETPQAKGSQVAPKVQADRFSPRPSGTKPPPVVKGDEVIYRREPFSVTTGFKIDSGTEGRESYQVPDEYLFVIETISVHCEFGPGQQPAVFWVRALLGPEKTKFLGMPSSKFANIYIPLSKQYEKNSGNSIWVGTQQVRTYASPGSKIIFKARLYKDKKYTYALCGCSLSGYQLDPDSPSLAP